MEFRLAKMPDLPRLKTMYQNIVGNMYRNGIRIWDDIYPCEFLQADIENERLYVLTEDQDFAAAFALCAANDGESFVKWACATAKACYIDRFGVNVNYLRRGIGGLMLKQAMALAKKSGADYLRLFVVDVNEPAIKLYIKNGFKRADGIYEEKIEDSVLREYGFEIVL